MTLAINITRIRSSNFTERKGQKQYKILLSRNEIVRCLTLIHCLRLSLFICITERKRLCYNPKIMWNNVDLSVR